MTLDDLFQTFELLGEWEERYRFIIDLGRKLEPLSTAERVEANKVRGCMSQVWLVSSVEPGPPARLVFRGDSDAHIVKGLIAILLVIFSGRTADEIRATDIHGIFERLGLKQHISFNRRNGLYAMVERIQELAQPAPVEQAGSAS